MTGEKKLIHQKRYVIGYGVGGFIFGAFFPVLGVTVDLWHRGLSFSFENISLIVASQPLHWLILTAVPVLTILSLIIGNRQIKLMVFSEGLEEKVTEKTKNYADVIDQLEHENEERAELEKSHYNVRIFNPATDTFLNKELHRGDLFSFKDKNMNLGNQRDKKRNLDVKNSL
ncbi:MAG: hypothetical protein HC802_16025 [Caldilineaceae bacterium]|nr:hypothetical protein [Caldilineaceae bacterium]